MKSVAGRTVNEKPSSWQTMKCRTVAKELYKFAYVFKSSIERRPPLVTSPGAGYQMDGAVVIGAKLVQVATRKVTPLSS
jgi:hypothetical protein